MKNVKTGHKVPIVWLDAGHYGKYNRSPVVPEYYESDMNWKLHLLLKAELEKYGIQVKTTRADKAKDLALEARGKASKDADLFISLHSNAASAESTKYVVAMYQVDDNCGEMDEQSKEFAGKLAKTVGNVMGLPYQTWSTKSSADRDGNGYKDDYYGVLRGAHAVHTPGVIIEHGFHTNTATAKWLLVDANLKKLAVAEAKTIAEWFDVEKIPEPEHWYRIRKAWDMPETQVAAYKDFELAKENCPDDYAVFDWNGKAVYERFGRYEAEEYPLVEFVKDIQKACGAAVDGIAGPETIGKTVTLSAEKNATHAAVKPVQKRLNALGYTEVGEADGIAGPKFTKAVKAFQKDNGCVVDGEITAGNRTWKKLLGV